jgi:hypothetical protein
VGGACSSIAVPCLARLGIVGVGWGGSCNRAIMGCREASVGRVFNIITCTISSPKSPTRLVRYFFKTMVLIEYRPIWGMGHVSSRAGRGEEGTDGFAAGRGCWSWLRTTGKQRQGKALTRRRPSLVRSSRPI